MEPVRNATDREHRLLKGYGAKTQSQIARCGPPGRSLTLETCRFTAILGRAGPKYMPKQDGSLTDADRITLNRALNNLIPTENSELAAGALGMVNNIERRAGREKATRSAFLRVVEALSLDPMAHAVGGFSAMTSQEQTEALLNIERTLPEEFSLVLGIVRDVYYEDDRTPGRPANFDGDNEVFGKVPQDADAGPGMRTPSPGGES